MKKVIVTGQGVKNVTFANDLPLSFICGPCAIESLDNAMKTAEILKTISEDLNIGMIYKSSFDKANRTSLSAERGVGLEEGLSILQKVKSEFNLPVITDIHNEQQVGPVSEVVDILQIPALLCRQTDLIMAAAESEKPVNIKKGQFLSPFEMKQVINKAKSTGNDNILVTERGVCHGYNNLISDMRSLRILSETGYPVIFDATHSVQIPGGAGDASSGKRKYVEPLARAAAAVGVAGFFMETHIAPEEAICDGPNMVPINYLKDLIITLKKIDDLSKSITYQDIQ